MQSTVKQLKIWSRSGLSVKWTHIMVLQCAPNQNGLHVGGVTCETKWQRNIVTNQKWRGLCLVPKDTLSRITEADLALVQPGSTQESVVAQACRLHCIISEWSNVNDRNQHGQQSNHRRELVKVLTCGHNRHCGVYGSDTPLFIQSHSCIQYPDRKYNP